MVIVFVEVLLRVIFVFLFMFCLDYGLVLNLFFKKYFFSDKMLYYFSSRLIERFLRCELIYINMVICYGFRYLGGFWIKKVKKLFEKINRFFFNNFIFYYKGLLFFWSFLFDIINLVSKEMFELGIEEMYFMVRCFFFKFCGILKYGYFNINYSFIVIDKLWLS